MWAQPIPSSDLDPPLFRHSIYRVIEVDHHASTRWKTHIEPMQLVMQAKHEIFRIDILLSENGLDSGTTWFHYSAVSSCPEYEF
jgi:hypothetical protein